MSKLRKALEKAKETRERSEGRRVDEETMSPKSGLTEDLPELDRCDINPTYKYTRVVNVAPDLLRNNKVISLCYENRMADQIKILRAQILKMITKSNGNSLLVTSANQGEGKTLTAINLALSMAQELDRTVLLVDADMRTPSIHRYLGLHGTPGLSEHLKTQADIADLLINPGLRRLTILPAGKPIPNSSELLGAPRMKVLVREMKGRYPERIIVFDSPSLLTCADPLVCARYVDGVLLVVEAEKTSKKDLLRAMELLKDRPIVGTVLNKAVG